MESNRFKELDALRGIAAIMVVLFHIMRKDQITKLGVTGVDLFFMISGFVIYMSLTKVKNSLEFVINRVSRLYPTYWACVTFTFLLMCTYETHYFLANNFINFLGNMTMFQYYLGMKDLDGPYWTMIIEMNFYIGILLLFHFKKLKYLNIIGIALSVIVAIMTPFFYRNLFFSSILTAIPLLTFAQLFFAGIVFYNIHQNKGKPLNNYIILFICFISRVLLFNYSGRTAGYITHVEYIIMLMIYFALFVLFVNGKLKFIVSKGTLFLGRISFPLYLIHQYVSLAVIITILTVKFNVPYWLAALIALITVIILASFTTYLIEIPLGKRMKKKLCSIAFNP
ncbi:MAG: acyltransferase family protein [Mucilaginibacter sp.]|nr:acyltransferase family protein [Mucilaginibacter sp.]